MAQFIPYLFYIICHCNIFKGVLAWSPRVTGTQHLLLFDAAAVEEMDYTVGLTCLLLVVGYHDDCAAVFLV